MMLGPGQPSLPALSVVSEPTAPAAVQRRKKLKRQSSLHINDFYV